MVKCWDLETNQVIRHYHGHLSGVFCLALHPTLDILVTGGRDAVARVWDVRSKTQIHVLAGHDHTVGSVVILFPNFDRLIRFTRNQPRSGAIKLCHVDSIFGIQRTRLNDTCGGLEVMSRLIIPKMQAAIIAATH